MVQGNSRLDAIREKEFCAGYAFSHEEIVQYIMTIIPQEEVIVELRENLLSVFQKSLSVSCWQML